MTNANKIKKSLIIIPKPIADLSQVVWLSVSEVSSLVGNSSSSIREAINERGGKHIDGHYQCRKTGNKYEILLTSIPNNAQTKYTENLLDALKTSQSTALTVKNDRSTLIINDVPGNYDFSVYDALFDEYGQKAPSIKAEAERRLSILDEYTELLELKVSKYKAEAIIKENHPDVSKTTLWRWSSLVKNHPRDYWLALLVPSYEGRQRTEIPKVAWDYFIAHYLSEAKPAAIVIYRDTLKAAVANAWGNLPSCKTFERRISDMHENLIILGRQGKTKLKESLPHAKQDYSKRPIHHTWEADGRRCDVWVKMPNGEVHRPWLVVIRELRTRMIIGFKIGISNDAALVVAALKDAFTRTQTRPEYFHFDNGTEYSNNLLTGGQKSTVRRQAEANKAIGFLTRLGIKVKWATARHGAAKTIESSWNGYAENVDKTFGRAYVGRNPVERPENSDPKYAVEYEVYEAKLYQHIIDFCSGAYGAHRGQGMDGKSPYKLYGELLRDHVSRPVTSFELATMRPIYQRTLSSQLVFKIKVKHYGELEYEAVDNGKLRRGFIYSVLLDPYNYNENALIYDGGKQVGEAKIKHAIDYNIDQGDDFAPIRRKRAIKNATAELRYIKNGVHDLKLVKPNEYLLPAHTPYGLLAAPAPKPLMQAIKEDPIQTLQDGSIINTETGNIIKPIEPDLSMFDLFDEFEDARKQKSC
jgi:transposase InsO family protein